MEVDVVVSCIVEWHTCYSRLHTASFLIFRVTVLQLQTNLCHFKLLFNSSL